ncbi:MAG: glutamine synthetase III [Planctomycetota bacterium]
MKNCTEKGEGVKEGVFSVTEIFGENVFSDAVMRERLPKNVYKALRRKIEEGVELDSALADVVASAMKDWAVERGATHYCHWFQPMTEMTAEKHDSFISPTPDGRTVMEFSGKELIQGEPDASSFPSGGLRATFEARGYTIWDCTSPVFVKGMGSGATLYIPSAFCSYRGEALDMKTPLLRSMDALNREALRVLRALGEGAPKRVTATLGAEQEYFLIDRRFIEKRLDIVLTGRTLFGAPSPKGQEMEDHYFGSIHERVAGFMSEFNTELWRLGVAAKTQHNEVAPAQYEIAPVFATINVATDHNHLTMETLQRVAIRHGFVCLLHEKPFAGVNGSGKHNNWSLMTDDGRNLLDPGKTPAENAVFLVFLFAVIRAVDRYAKLLRASVANAGNDHRLGANEAPPAVVSVFLGDELTEIFESLAKGGARKSRASGQIRLGVSTLPPLPKDCTDRNRTSPFAFTGNKFEFRMVGSSMSTAGSNFVLNTIVADVLAEIAGELEKAEDVTGAAQAILQRFAREHERILFNGDNYTAEWLSEAKKRGLPNLSNAVDALNSLVEPEAVELFRRHSVLAESELRARHEIQLETYAKTIHIEALTTIQIARRSILPVVLKYAGEVAGAAEKIEAIGSSGAAHKRAVDELCSLVDALQGSLQDLDAVLAKVVAVRGSHKRAVAYRDEVIPSMGRVRKAADALERIVDAKAWPLPTYAEMLFLR